MNYTIPLKLSSNHIIFTCRKKGGKTPLVPQKCYPLLVMLRKKWCVLLIWDRGQQQSSISRVKRGLHAAGWVITSCLSSGEPPGSRITLQHCQDSRQTISVLILQVLREFSQTALWSDWRLIRILSVEMNQNESIGVRLCIPNGTQFPV